MARRRGCPRGGSAGRSPRPSPGPRAGRRARTRRSGRSGGPCGRGPRSRSWAGAARRGPGPSARRGRRPSRRLDVGEVLREMLAQDVADPRALVASGEPVAPEQLLLALDRLRPRDLPAYGEALEEELDGALPRVLALEAAGAHAGVLGAGGRRHRAAQDQRVALRALVAALGRGERLRAAAAAPLPHQVSDAARSSCARTSPVTGSAWPAHAADGSSAASLRIDARACSVSRLNPWSGTRGGPWRPVPGSSV